MSTIIDDIANFVGASEGCANCKKDGLVHVYLCPAGYATQGYGIRVKDLNVPPITKEEALKRFKNVIPKYVQHALYHSPSLASHPSRLIAITSFIYNLGPAAYASSTLKKRINKEDWEGAAREIVKWNHGGGKVLKGLTIRRKKEAQLILGVQA
jgi:GH24 family phage-related lysozyme (muramidase)